MHLSASGSTLSCDTPRRRRGGRVNARSEVTLRRRTLDDYPMDHDRKDALRMLHELRSARAEQLVTLQSSLGDTRRLSASSRKRFLGAVSGQPVTPLTTDFVKEESKRGLEQTWPTTPISTRSQPTHVPTWSRPRYNSIATVPVPQQRTEVQEPIRRPVSEPPRPLTPGGRHFNHLRTCIKAYPSGLSRLLHDYNTKLRVECDPVITNPIMAQPEEIRHCRLLPLVTEDTEKNEEVPEAGISSPAELLPPSSIREDESQRLAEEIETEHEAKIEEESHTETQKASVSIKSETTAQRSKKKQGKIGPPSPEPVAIVEPVAEATSSASANPTYYCWVDDATVSSVSDHAVDVADLQDVDIEGIGDISEKQPEHEDISLGGLKTPANTRNNTISESKPVTPVPLVEIGSPLKRKTSKDKRKTEPVVETLPEVPIPEEPLPDVVPQEEEVEEELEEEVEPVLPAFICPSSEEKSHMTETKRWLMKSSFEAAYRQTPIL